MIPVAWKVDSRACWIQTRCPRSSKRLGKVKGARLVAESYTGEYLRTYEVPWTISRAREWVIRAVKDLHGPRQASMIARHSQASLTGRKAV